jgi:hypothetical protein
VSICKYDDCTHPIKARGWCLNHYMRYHRVGFRICPAEGCERPARQVTGFCAEHSPTICSVSDCTRPRSAKGYCNYHWRKHQDPNRTCEVCGAKYVGDPRSRWCSRHCKARGQRNPLRNALDDGDLIAILRTAQEQSTLTAAGCWKWNHATNSAGYPVLGQGGRAGLVHRKIVAAVLGRPLGREPVHHKCANRGCVNPDHLQPISQRENMAEMFARHTYLSRISELEEALRALDPDHALLR